MRVNAFGRSELEQLFRYAYSGFLFTGILLFVVPDDLRGFLDAGGNVVTPLVIVAIGAAIYVLYRHVLNELLLSPWILHPLHSLIDCRQDIPTNPANFLKRHGVPWRLRHAAYVDIRRGFFEEDQRQSFNRNHTEATIVWLTAVESTIAGCVLLKLPSLSHWKAWLLLLAGVSTIVAAILMDIRLFKQESRVLLVKENGLPEFLRKLGYIK